MLFYIQRVLLKIYAKLTKISIDYTFVMTQEVSVENVYN